MNKKLIITLHACRRKLSGTCGVKTFAPANMQSQFDTYTFQVY